MPFLVPFSRNLEFVGHDKILQKIGSNPEVTIFHGPDGIG
jgi:hypothetical protein